MVSYENVRKKVHGERVYWCSSLENRSNAAAKQRKGDIATCLPVFFLAIETNCANDRALHSLVPLMPTATFGNELLNRTLEKTTSEMVTGPWTTPQWAGLLKLRQLS